MLALDTAKRGEIGGNYDDTVHPDHGIRCGVDLEPRVSFRERGEGHRFTDSCSAPSIERCCTLPGTFGALWIARLTTKPARRPPPLDFRAEPRSLGELGMGSDQHLGLKEGAFGGVDIECRERVS